MSARTPGERRVQFVAFWAGCSLAAIYGLVATTVGFGVIAHGLLIIYAAVVGAAAAFSDRAWYSVDKLTPGGNS